ncbi:unnamed protein product [Urochloa humidicola]
MTAATAAVGAVPTPVVSAAPAPAPVVGATPALAPIVDAGAGAVHIVFAAATVAATHREAIREEVRRKKAQMLEARAVERNIACSHVHGGTAEENIRGVITEGWIIMIGIHLV